MNTTIPQGKRITYIDLGNMAGDGNEEVYDAINDGLYSLTMWYVALICCPLSMYFV